MPTTNTIPAAELARQAGVFARAAYNAPKFKTHKAAIQIYEALGNCVKLAHTSGNNQLIDHCLACQETAYDIFFSAFPEQMKAYIEQNF